MNTRIHAFKVYQIRTLSGMIFWTFRMPDKQEAEGYGDEILTKCSLRDLLYFVRDGAKENNGKSKVTKNDLEFLLQELAHAGNFEKIAAQNE